MFNLPVKLSLMSGLYESVSPQVFLDKTPRQALMLYKQQLPDYARHIVEFAFTDDALLLILENDFEVSPSYREIRFAQKAIDTESWLRANGLTNLPVIEKHQHTLETLTEKLWSQTGELIEHSVTLETRLELRKQIKMLYTLYFERYGQREESWLHFMETRTGQSHFLNLVVAECLFKADGARMLLGRNSNYCQLWLEKEREFFHYANGIHKLPLRFTA